MNRRHAILSLAALSFAPAARAGTSVETLDPEIVRGLGVFERYGRTPPTGDSIIYLHGEAAHHSTIEFMTVAARDAAGRWTISTVGEERSGMLEIKPGKIMDKTGVLAAGDAEALDALLALPELYQEQDSMREPPGGGLMRMMEIHSPNGRLVIRWTNRLGGKAGEVAVLVLDRV
ncbi:hypothetical protein QO010_004473 [Caulobacter ginsengisoli]|uniref:Uncharacterized protein n=1 Tax=Caulobacter ginsengisoli TaxID=400775 RepID=A0ABU0IXE0_9CAUL|nr:hypothetical protein [Caulobacter ginsengisoli]MDQ0466677.1 hypothetical protein [Caulobacter ginsengisoli]